MRAGFERSADLGAALALVREFGARTVIFDVEPLVAGWDSGQEALDEGVARVVAGALGIPGLLVACFSTNSARRPRAVPDGRGVRVVWLALAGKPLRLAPYRSFPCPGIVVGDQVATDGLLARRLGYRFVHYCPRLDAVPAGPRLMSGLGRLVRPLVFTRRP